MSFTDNDLERWKTYTNGMPIPVNALYEIKQMIARLEAAERAIDAWEAFSLEIHSRVRNTKKEFGLRMSKANAMEAWRRAKGEGAGK